MKREKKQQQQQQKQKQKQKQKRFMSESSQLRVVWTTLFYPQFTTQHFKECLRNFRLAMSALAMVAKKMALKATSLQKMIFWSAISLMMGF